MTDEQLTALAECFCATPLPWSVAADGCATQPGFNRTGTNLLTVAQAKEVLAAALSATPAPSGQDASLPDAATPARSPRA